MIVISCETWPIEETTKRMLETAEVDFYQRTAGSSKLQRVTTDEGVWEIVPVTHTIR